MKVCMYLRKSRQDEELEKEDREFIKRMIKKLNNKKDK